jgi:PEGA domain
MTARFATALALALSVQPGLALADNAHARGGSDGGSASAGAQHHSSSSGSSQPAGGSQTSSGSSSSSSSDPQLTDAQRRHPRAGTGTGYRHGGRVFVSPYYGAYYGYPGFYGYYPYDSFYSGFGYPYYYPYGYGGYGYGGYGYGYGGYCYGTRRYRETASIRLQVDPPETRVYVDGYYAGVVDDFDGIFQRLHVSPGRHEVTLKLDGYRTHKFKAYVSEDHTLKVHYDMAKGSGEDPEEVVGDPATVERRAREARDEGRYGYRDMDRRERDRDDDDADAPDMGRLVLEVRPGDASIYVDGEFRGTARDRMSLRLAPGHHRIEVVRPGFRTAEREVDLRPGKTTDINLELDRS